MKKTIIAIIMIIMLVLGIVLCNYSMAANDAYKITLVPASTSSYKQGDEIDIVVRVSDIQGDGIAIVSGFLNYNKDVFDCVGFYGWDARYNPDIDWAVDPLMDRSELQNDGEGIPITTYYILEDKDNQGDRDLTNTDANILRVILTVKSTAADGNYEISFNNIEAADNGTEPLPTTNAILPVTVGNGSTNPNTNNTTNNNTTNNNTTNNNTTNNNTTNNNITNNNTNSNTNNTNTNGNTNGSTNTNQNTNNNIINTILPYAGINTPIFGIGILVLIIVGGTSIYKYKKYKSLK